MLNEACARARSHMLAYSWWIYDKIRILCVCYVLLITCANMIFIVEDQGIRCVTLYWLLLSVFFFLSTDWYRNPATIICYIMAADHIGNSSSAGYKSQIPFRMCVNQKPNAIDQTVTIFFPYICASCVHCRVACMQHSIYRVHRRLADGQ